MPRLRNAALAATVLAVGALLAFREGAFYQRAAGVEPLPTKTLTRSHGEDSAARRERTKGDVRKTAVWRQQQMEAFLTKRGRTSVNLIAAYLICENPAWRDELRLRTDDPVAMEFLAIREPGMPAYPEHLLRLEPYNPQALLLKARSMGSYDPAADPQPIRDLILGAGMTSKCIRHSEAIEAAVRDARHFLGEELRDIWAGVPEVHKQLDFSDRLADLHPSQYARRMLEDADVSTEGKEQMANAVGNIVNSYAGAGDIQACLRWAEVLAGTPYETAYILQRRDQFRSLVSTLDQSFLAALEIATSKQILSMEVRSIRNSSLATRMALINEIDPEALRRRINERKQKASADQDAAAQSP